MVGCGDAWDGFKEGLDVGDQKTYIVTYRVTGSIKFIRSVTISNRDGGTEQHNDLQAPWTYRFAAKPGAWLYISAHNDEFDGSITAEILLNDVVVKTATSHGAFTIASVSGKL